MSNNTEPENPDSTTLSGGSDTPDSELSNFEKKMLQHEKDIREGKSDKGKDSKIPVREKRETSEEEKNPQWRLHPLATAGVIAILAVLAIMVAIVIVSGDNEASGSESQSIVSEEVSSADENETIEENEGAE